MFDINQNTKIIFDDNLNRINIVEDKICPKCGLSFVEVKKFGVVGCANCYTVFENELKSIILKEQGTINHIGKISAKRFSKLKIKEKIAKLEQDKEEAIRAENFIVAESLKNQIEKLKGELLWKITVQ